MGKLIIKDEGSQNSLDRKLIRTPDVFGLYLRHTPGQTEWEVLTQTTDHYVYFDFDAMKWKTEKKEKE